MHFPHSWPLRGPFALALIIQLCVMMTRGRGTRQGGHRCNAIPYMVMFAGDWLSPPL
ncbi:unnamed protein product [Tenebrio molitor]|nr:unnamed protein product [Tenebrio molitor]